MNTVSTEFPEADGINKSIPRFFAGLMSFFFFLSIPISTSLLQVPHVLCGCIVTETSHSPPRGAVMIIGFIRDQCGEIFTEHDNTPHVNHADNRKVF